MCPASLVYTARRSAASDRSTDDTGLHKAGSDMEQQDARMRRRRTIARQAVDEVDSRLELPLHVGGHVAAMTPAVGSACLCHCTGAVRAVERSQRSLTVLISCTLVAAACCLSTVVVHTLLTLRALCCGKVGGPPVSLHTKQQQ